MFPEEKLKALVQERVEAFFEAFYFGEEPAYDLELGFGAFDPERKFLRLELRLKARPGKCLACNLTWGLPDIFEKHPILNLKGVVAEVGKFLPDGFKVRHWELGPTEEVDENLHIIPLLIYLD